MFCLAQDSVCEVLTNLDIIPLVAIGGGLLVAIIAIVMTTIAGIMKTRAREETKREIAAYVAEGTIDPDKAIAMLNAGRSSCDIKNSG
jgi:type III secretory pathway component EscV